MAKKVLVPIANGSEEIEAVCIIDTLRRAGAEVTVASVDGLQLTASRGVKIVADAKIADCTGQTYDCIALPGGMPGAEHLRDSVELIGMLKKQKQAGRLYAAICASPAVALAPHGLLDGVRATCFPSLRGKLNPRYASDERVVVDGNCVTSQGPGTAIEFALELIELLFGPEKAKEVAAPMLVRA
jgi:4-methyl-5(b-hydroxyethyl)-thiazole monophosphate biosynthesis